MACKSPLVSIVIPTHNRKDKLIRLLNSVFQSSYDNMETIVVDDASTDGTFEEVKKFKNVKIVRSERELFLAASRNIGIRKSEGDYVFLIDDDNVISKTAVAELLRVFCDKPQFSIGILAPMTYYLREPSRIWCCGIKINMITSLTKVIGRDEIDRGQFGQLIESQGFPNAFMIKKDVIREVGLFDERSFPIHYDEADFGERVRRRFKIFCNPSAKVWHDISLPGEITEQARALHCHTQFRAYYCGRNRIIFHARYSNLWQFLAFVLFFSWPFAAYYLKVIIFGSKEIFNVRLKIAFSYVRGFLDGLANVYGEVHPR